VLNGIVIRDSHSKPPNPSHSIAMVGASIFYQIAMKTGAFPIESPAVIVTSFFIVKEYAHLGNLVVPLAMYLQKRKEITKSALSGLVRST